MGYQQRTIDASVFRAYDIRGIIGTELDANAYYSIGLAFACRMKSMGKTQLFLARDARLSSDELATALRCALLDSGMDVLDIGEAATPVLYYATARGDIDCGMMVTGSHNPAQYNGIKMVLAGKTLVAEDIQALYQLVNEKARVQGVGVLQTQNIIPEYTQRIISDISLKRPLKVVVDCGNGVAGPTIPKVIEALGCEVIPLYCDVDGRFPNHHPDPTIPENLIDLQQAVIKNKADIGLAFDGDADRLGVVTQKAEIIWPDRLMMFYAKHLLHEIPNARIVFDVKCSNHLRAVIEQYKGEAIMCPTGHSIVKSVMREQQAQLAGEMSGHLFFNDRWYGFDDALYSACRLLEYVSQSPESLSEQFQSIPNGINTPELKLPINESEKFTFMEKFIASARFENATCMTIDGLRVEFAKGWGLLRASNTSPYLIARFEAEDAQQLASIQMLFYDALYQLDPNIALAFKELL